MNWRLLLSRVGLWYYPDRDALPRLDNRGQPKEVRKVKEVDSGEGVVFGKSGIMYREYKDNTGQYEFSYEIGRGQSGRTADAEFLDRCNEAGVKVDTVMRVKPLFERGLSQGEVVKALEGERGFGLRTVQKCWAVLSPTPPREGGEAQGTRKKIRLRKLSLKIN